MIFITSKIRIHKQEINKNKFVIKKVDFPENIGRSFV